MEMIIVILVAVAATTSMTLFNFLLSDIRKINFREPHLLAKILSSGDKNLSRKDCYAGWALHYMIGLFFIMGFQFVFNYDLLHTTWISALVLGAVGGIIGILGWKLVIKITYIIPHFEFRKYYLQLLGAHTIFALTAIAIFKIYNL